MNTSTVSVALPTRGLIFSSTLKSLQRNGLTNIAIVDGMPIPDCHNKAVLGALEFSPTHVFMAEEDMEYPDGTIERMLALNAYITVCDYPMGPKWMVISRDGDTIRFGGTGCMLVRKEVFDQMPYPWFENDVTYDVRTWKKLKIPSKYGGQDVNFCFKARQMGFEIKEATPPVHHWRCKNLERMPGNHGCWTFYELIYGGSK